LLVIVLLGLLLRLGFVVVLEAGWLFGGAEAGTRGDTKKYDEIARNFLAGRGLIASEERKVARMPLYPLFLAAVYHLVGQRFLYVRLVQAVVSVAGCYLLYLVGKELFGASSGLWAAAIGAVYPFFVFFAGVVLTEALFIVVLLVVLFCLVKFQGSEGLVWAALCGVFSALGALMKPSFLPLLPAVAPILVLMARNRWKAARGLVLAILVLVAGMSPWVIRNRGLC